MIAAAIVKAPSPCAASATGVLAYVQSATELNGLEQAHEMDEPSSEFLAIF